MTTNYRKRLALVPWSFSPRSAAEDIFSWSPFSSLQRQVNHLFEDFVPKTEGVTKTFSPSVALSENEDSIFVDVELAGMNDKDVELALTPEYLTIRGEKKSQEEQKSEKGKYYSERSYGFFERLIPLSVEVDEDTVDAQFKDGVLHVTLKKSKSERNGPKKIPIRGSSNATP